MAANMTRAEIAEEAKRLMIDWAEEVWQAGTEGFNTQTVASCREARAKAVAAIDQLAAHQTEGWQPIETAPKDGTAVLLGRFAPGKQHDRLQSVDFWHTLEKHGYTGWGRFNPTYWPATHWCSLPAAPSIPSNGGAGEAL